MNLNKEEQISEFYADDGSRKATISRDKYHMIVRLYDIVQGGLLREYDTILFTDKSIRYLEDTCENFVMYYGAFKLEENTRQSADSNAVSEDAGTV